MAVRIFRCGNRPPVTVDFGGGVQELLKCSNGNFDHVDVSRQQSGLSDADLDHNSVYFQVISYRDENEVAKTTLDAKVGEIVGFSKRGAFSNLTSLDIGLDLMTFGGDHVSPTNAYHICENGCSRVTINNLFLDVTG